MPGVNHTYIKNVNNLQFKKFKLIKLFNYPIQIKLKKSENLINITNEIKYISNYNKQIKSNYVFRSFCDMFLTQNGTYCPIP